MKSNNFSPSDKTFCFNLTENTCHRCKTQICPLDCAKLSEIANFTFSGECVRRNSSEYCMDLAKKMMQNSLVTTRKIKIYHYGSCNHYGFDDGQHRTCVAAHLIKRGIDIKLNIEFYKSSRKCPYCKAHEIRGKEENAFFVMVRNETEICDTSYFLYDF